MSFIEHKPIKNEHYWQKKDKFKRIEKHVMPLLLNNVRTYPDQTVSLLDNYKM